MKIGILSMQRITNYGSFLQAYGLKQTIENILKDSGKVEFVDYKVCLPRSVDVSFYKKNAIYQFAKRINKILVKKGVIGHCQELEKAYVRFIKKYFGITDKLNLRPKLDLLVVGSDEVFNCLQENYDVGYSMELFGKNNRAKDVISYAASFGTTTLEKIEKYNVRDELSGLLKNNFSELSVRDDNSFEVVKGLTGKEPQRHVDPVFLGDFDALIPEKVDLSDYIVLYGYAGRFSDEKEIKAIKAYAEKNNKKLLTIGNTQGFEDINITVDPFELLAYIKNAYCVITDTFHGTVFSIKYNKRFATLVRQSNKQKLTSLLKQFGLEQKTVENIDDLEKILDADIDFSIANKKIEEEKQRSCEYLKKHILIK